tara:strand:- start:348 stop:572 length:225 start_codon:yes stop_codon:yes gene_type:complete
MIAGNFTYDRSYDSIYEMIEKAESKKNKHLTSLQTEPLSRKEKIHHIRQVKALEGVVKALRWSMGDKDIKTPLQ